MTRDEVLTWLRIEGEQLDRLLERGLPTMPGGQYSANEVAEWLNANGLAETPEPALPPYVFRTRREAAYALGRSISTVDGWFAMGCPGVEGRYDINEMRRWRDERDRQHKRPLSYGTADAPTPERLDELREIITREINDESGTHCYAVGHALVDILKLGHQLPEDIDKRRKLLIEAIGPHFKPWITSEADMPAKVEDRVRDVLEPWGVTVG